MKYQTTRPMPEKLKMFTQSIINHNDHSQKKKFYEVFFFKKIYIERQAWHASSYLALVRPANEKATYYLPTHDQNKTKIHGNIAELEKNM